MVESGTLRVVMHEGARHPTICVADAEGRWLPLQGVSRIEVVCDARDGGGLPRMRVDFEVMSLTSFDMQSEPGRTILGLAGVSDAMIEAAKLEMVNRAIAG